MLLFQPMMCSLMKKLNLDVVVYWGLESVCLLEPKSLPIPVLCPIHLSLSTILITQKKIVVSNDFFYFFLKQYYRQYFYFILIDESVLPISPGSVAYVYHNIQEEGSEVESLAEEFWGLDIADEEDEEDVEEEEDGGSDIGNIDHLDNEEMNVQCKSH